MKRCERSLRYKPEQEKQRGFPGSSVGKKSACDSGKNTGVGCHGLLQGIFPTQGSNPGVQHCRRIPPEKPKNTGVNILSLLQGILKTRNWSRLSKITGRFFTSWATREAPLFLLFSFLSYTPLTSFHLCLPFVVDCIFCVSFSVILFSLCLHICGCVSFAWYFGRPG